MQRPSPFYIWVGVSDKTYELHMCRQYLYQIRCNLVRHYLQEGLNGHAGKRRHQKVSDVSTRIQFAFFQFSTVLSYNFSISCILKQRHVAEFL